MNWIYYSLAAAFSWGVGQIFTKKGLSNLSSLYNAIISFSATVLLWIPYALYNGVNFSLILKILPLTIIACLTYPVYYYVIELGQVSLTGTIFAVYPLFTVILSQIFLHEKISNFQVLAIILLLTGVVISGIPTNLKSLKEIKFEKWFIWAILGALVIGCGDFLSKVAINISDVNTYLFTCSLSYIPAVSLLYIFDKKGRKIGKIKFSKLLPSIIGVYLIQIGIIPFSIGLGIGLASLVAPLSSTYAIISVILAFIFLKEKVNKIQFSGIIITCLGIIMLGII